MLLLMADEEVGDAGVGAPFFVEERPALCPDFVVGEGSGERYETAAGPVYLLDCGVKASATATLTVRGVTGDASLRDAGHNAVLEAARLLMRLAKHDPRPRMIPEMVRMLDELGDGAERNPALAQVVDALRGSVFQPTVVEAKGPKNVVPPEATVTIYCALTPGTSADEAERELREALGEGLYDLEVTEPEGGSTSDPASPLRDAIEGFLAEHDPGARLVPALGYGYSDCDLMRRAYGSCAYGFIPFRHADPLVNFAGKHGPDERVLAADVEFQALAARHVALAIGSGVSGSSG